jgi:hypothetical protein
MIRKKRKKFFTFDQSKLSEMIAVIGRVKDVGIFQLAESHQFAKDFLDSFVDALQRLKPFCHEQVRKTMMDWLHFAQPTQNPLLVRIGGEIVAGRPVSRHVEKHVRILRSRVLGAVRRRETHHQMERLVVVVLLRLAEETNRIVRDQIRVIIRLVVGAVLNLSRSALLKTLSLLKKRKKVPDSLSPRKERKRKKNVNFNKIPVDVGLNGSRRRRAKKRKRGRKIFSYLLSVEVDGVVVVS